MVPNSCHKLIALSSEIKFAMIVFVNVDSEDSSLVKSPSILNNIERKMLDHI